MKVYIVLIADDLTGYEEIDAVFKTKKLAEKHINLQKEDEKYLYRIIDELVLTE